MIGGGGQQPSLRPSAQITHAVPISVAAVVGAVDVTAVVDGAAVGPDVTATGAFLTATTADAADCNGFTAADGAGAAVVAAAAKGSLVTATVVIATGSTAAVSYTHLTLPTKRIV